MPEWSDELRAPFPPEVIGKLPRVTCKACSGAQFDPDQKGKHCQRHKMVKCAECGNWITEGHIHLDYVGHAVATDRLLKVDPEWTWEPAAVDDTGLPVMLRHGDSNGLWIKLTIKGVTRYGFGDGPTVKECISDAIRNAAMRFGVALDLWAKGDLQSDASSQEDSRPAPGAAGHEAPTQSRPANKATIAATKLKSGEPIALDPHADQRQLLRGLVNDIRARDEKNAVVVWWDGLKPSGQKALSGDAIAKATERARPILAGLSDVPADVPVVDPATLDEFDKVAK